MKESTLALLRCPNDHCGTAPLTADVWARTVLDTGETELVEGVVACASCGGAYPVVSGVLILVEDLAAYLRDHLGVITGLAAHGPSEAMAGWLGSRAPAAVDPRHVNRSMKLEDRYVNAFLGAHFDHRATDVDADPLIADLLAANADRDLWATATTLFDRTRPLTALDVGSSVGGLSALLSRRRCATVGVDTSFLSVLVARRALLSSPGPLDGYRVYREGDLYDERPLTVAGDPRHVDFIVGSGLTRLVRGPVELTCAVNLIDLVPDPARLLDTLISQTAEDGHLLVTSPYGWSGVPRSRWLGGTSNETSPAALRAAGAARGLKVVWENERVPWLWRDYSRFWRLYSVDVVLFRRT
ncbi:methyltransferase domain-containing protein [Streptomyces sp. SID9727]|uniref:class I SAM-dependent methyltransferase n=1 Tax=Streptomyces sp. SID9727 TaxID=2706114 RepID=UPI0013CA44AC|nr:methyltransferase domain-containing protein [Streptomyces sp. SID9727]NEC66049.1 methyltransferase domain-containing protein [Streptomyces sp. SID9727]